MNPLVSTMSGSGDKKVLDRVREDVACTRYGLFPGISKATITLANRRPVSHALETIRLVGGIGSVFFSLAVEIPSTNLGACNVLYEFSEKLN